MTRLERIIFNKWLGLDASKFEAMTDAEYEAQIDFENERALRNARAFRDNARIKRTWATIDK